MSVAWRPCLLVVLTLAVLACNGGKQESRIMTAETWAKLEKKRVVFGHQSVGLNILRGVQTLAVREAAHFRVTEARDLSAAGNIVHFNVGTNGDPLSKLKDFASILRSGPTADVDVAMMKLCYIDFEGDVDPARMAEQYIATLDGLGVDFPHIQFVAFTAPLTVAQTGPKAWAKRVLGRTPAGYAENVRRKQFNDRLRARYKPEGRLFDLAQIEVQSAATDSYLGQPFEALSPALTSDGGHLNAEGERVVGAQLLEFLATLPLNPTIPLSR